MAENITLNNVATFQNDTTAVNTVNANSATITTAFQDVLSLSGQSPNKMGSPLDMNSWPIMNLPAPGSPNSPARLIDVTSTNPITVSLSLTGDVTAPASSGVLTTTITGLSGTKLASGTVTGTQLASGTVTASNIASGTITNTQIASGTITSANIGTNVVGNTNIRQGAAKSVVGVTGNATANVADIAGTTRQVLAVSTAGTSLVFAQPQGDQLLGTITNDNATAGNVGEYIVGTVTSPGSSISTATPANITSISLTAGDWDVWGITYFVPAASTTVTIFQSSISTTSATINQAPGVWQIVNQASSAPAASVSFIVGPTRLSLSTTTTVFLVAQSTFATSTMTAYGTLQARRIR